MSVRDMVAQILVVDDHPAVAAAIKVVLRKAGHQVTIVHDGRATSIPWSRYIADAAW